MKQVTIPTKGSYEPPIKRLSDAEFRARLDIGLCFRCNKKYSHGHRCNIKEKRELMLFIVNEEESIVDEGTSKENSEGTEVKFYWYHESSLAILDHDVLGWGKTICSRRGSHSH